VENVHYDHIVCGLMNQLLFWPSGISK